MPNKEVLAYTAGFLDGEGSIQINPSKNRKGGAKYWCLTIQISSCVPEVLESLRKDWGNIGSITFWQPKNSPKRRIAYNWRIYSKECEIFLPPLLPYLRIKKAQAEVALKLRKLMGYTKKTLTQEISQERSLLALEMRDLNSRHGKSTQKVDITDVR